MTKCVNNDILIPEMAELLHEGKDVRFTPTGVSMRPFIEGGKDVVVLRKLPDVRVGDISLAAINRPISNSAAIQSPTAQRSNISYVLHRVISVRNDHVTLLGDGNIGATEQCTTSDILGTVIRIETAGGRRKPLTRGRLWYHLRGGRRIMLKVYRKWIKLVNQLN